MRAGVLASVLTLLQLQLLVRGFDTSNSTGMSPKETGRRVLFGAEADPKSFPFLVLLVNGNSFCSGSIIHNHWVMTAAHCVHNSVCESLKLRPAVSFNEKIYPYVCHVHPEFVFGRFRHDISLLKVKENLILGDRRSQLIHLPGAGMHYPPGTLATVVGWGSKENGKYPGRQLLRGTVEVQDWDECNREWKSLYVLCGSGCEDIATRTICTKGPVPNPAGTCAGDSGGPLIINGHVAGVASAVLMNKVDNRCIIGTPSLFVSVTDYLPWIYSRMWPHLPTSLIQVKPEH